jgi:hypothetical protein
MKLLYLPAKPMLTKKGKPRKRNSTTRGRLFFEDGRELPLVATLSIEADPVDIKMSTLGLRSARPRYKASRLVLEIDRPEVEIVSEVPKQKKS